MFIVLFSSVFGSVLILGRQIFSGKQTSKNQSHVILVTTWGSKRPCLYAGIPVHVLKVPVGDEEGHGGLPNLLKMEGERRNEEDIQDSLVVQEGRIVKFLLVPVSTFAAPASRFFPTRRSKETTS